MKQFTMKTKLILGSFFLLFMCNAFSFHVLASEETLYLANQTFTTNDGFVISYQDAIDFIIADAVSYMQKLNVSPSDQLLVIQDIKDQLYYQQFETEKRFMEHGIQHVLGNWERSRFYLDSRGNISTEYYFALLLAQVYHDTGYTMEPCTYPFNSGKCDTSVHDKNSLAYFEADDTYPIYLKILGNDILNDMKHALSTHNSDDLAEVAINTSLSADVLTSTLQICDKLALSIREKLPPVIEFSPDTLQVLTKYYPGINLENSSDFNDALRYEFYKQIDLNDFSPELENRFCTAVQNDLSLRQAVPNTRMVFLYTPSNSYYYNATTKENEIRIYELIYKDQSAQFPSSSYSVVKKLFGDLIMPGETEDADEYDARIRSAYNEAITQAGYEFADHRGLHIYITQLNIENLPNNRDYLEYFERINSVY